MLKRMATISAAAVLSELPALAFDFDAMSAEERETFRAEIRAYLLEHPHVLFDAIAALEDREASERASSADTDLIHANSERTF